MVPDIKVPANFGRQHIGSPSHDNLVLNLKDTQKIRANSMILSLNSPVIDKLTTELHQTSLEMDDFHGDAVNCFIECCYIGELESVQKCTFRDVNKMAHVFEVSWLVSRCAGYFGDVVDNIELEGDTWYNEVLYVFEEARYMYNTLKKENFLRLVTRKVEPTKDEFARSYMKKFDDLSKDQLWLMIELVGNNVEILVDIFVKHCSVSSLMELDENTRYFINNADLTYCYLNDASLYDNLFDMLQQMEDLPNEDLRMVLALNRKVTKSVTKSVTTSNSSVAADNLTIPNLFHRITNLEDFAECTSVRQIIDKVCSSLGPNIRNMYMFVDAIHFVLRFETCPNWGFGDITAIEYIMQCRGWKPMSKKYVSELGEFNDTHHSLKSAILSSDVLVSTEEMQEMVSKSSPISVRDFFTKDSRFLFHFKSPSFEHCPKEQFCGFVLKISPWTTDGQFRNFNIELSYDSDDYDSDVHIHGKLVCAANMHVAIRAINYRVGEQTWYTWPISWYDRPRLIQVMGTKRLSWGGVFDVSEKISLVVFMTK